MQGPLIVADVSKDSSHIQAFKNINEPICQPFAIFHRKDGYEKIDSLVKELKKATKKKEVNFCFEFTGIFSSPIFKYCFENGLRCYGISPVESAKIRKSYIRVTKTDKLDCGNIADVFYLRTLRETPFENNNFSSLMRSRRLLVNDLVKSCNLYIHLLDMIWPKFDDIFEENTNECALEFLKHFKHPYFLSRRSEEEIKQFVYKLPYIRERDSFALKIVDYSNKVYSSIDKNDEMVSCLIYAINNYQTIRKAICETERKAFDLCQNENDFNLYQTIPGSGNILAMRLKYCIGEYQRFSSRKKLAAFAGIDPAILASGKNKGEHLHITRKGNSYLRSTLYLIFSNMLMHHSDNKIIAFYHKKKSSGFPSKVAAIAACHKLLNCIYGMLINNTPFKPF